MIDRSESLKKDAKALAHASAHATVGVSSPAQASQFGCSNDIANPLRASINDDNEDTGF